MLFINSHQIYWFLTFFFQVIMPIWVLKKHWAIAVLHFADMTLTIYNFDISDMWVNKLNSWLTQCHFALQDFLMRIGDTTRANRAGSLSSVWQDDIPRAWAIGDSGPYTCQAMSLLVANVIPSRDTMDETPLQTRRRMADILWHFCDV